MSLRGELTVGVEYSVRKYAAVIASSVELVHAHQATHARVGHVAGHELVRVARRASKALGHVVGE